MILQRRTGHRATTDDLLVAWAGAEYAPQAQRVLDLGTGKATVALLLLHALPNAHVLGVEAFRQSYDLGVRNASLNGLTARLTLKHGDLRDQKLLADEGPFDLVMGAPPFMAQGSGTLPQDAQRAAGRFELRGGVEDYYKTATKNLTPDGVVIVLMDGNGAERNLVAARTAGLYPHHSINVLPRPRHPATYSICVARRQPGDLMVTELPMRLSEGDAWSPDYTSIRRRLDLPGANT
jgi:tRNA1Val (adenine37-N6)-methyltransferase